MPYERNSELPKGVKDHLPPHAETIYREAFNNALHEYDEDEARAARVAWGAVKRSYHKNDQGRWVKGASADSHHPG